MSDYGHTEYRHPRWPAFAAFGIVGALAAALGMVAYLASGGGGSRTVSGSGEEKPAGAKAGQSGASTAHQVVMDFYRDSANDPKSLEFVRWGPDDLRGEVKATFAKWTEGLGKDPKNRSVPINTNNYGQFLSKVDQIVRVRLRGKNNKGVLALDDMLVGLANGKVVAGIPNVGGDDWISRFKADYGQ